MTLRHEAGEVYCARFSPNGQWLLTAGQDGTARVWDAQKGSVHHVLRHSGEVNWADFAPDGRSVATAGDAGAISLWDLATGLRVVQITHAHRGEVSCVRFTPDGLRLVSAGRDGELALWDVATGNPLARCNGGVDAIESLDLSAHGSILIGGGMGIARGEIRSSAPLLRVHSNHRTLSSCSP